MQAIPNFNSTDFQEITNLMNRTANGNIVNNIITTSSMNTFKYQIFAKGMNFGQLTVLNVVYNDRGTYTCTATNTVGSVVDSGSLTVQGRNLFSLLDYTI